MLGLVLLAAAAAAPNAADSELAALRRALPAAVDEWNPGVERSREDLARWKRRLDGSVTLWSAFRDARCDPRLLGYEAGPGADPAQCRRRITGVIVEDLRSRFDIPPGGRPRASVEESQAGLQAVGSEEGGPCADAPPAECDYCGMNHCWEKRLAANDRALNAAWRSALAAVGAKPGLTAAQRSDWTARLRAAQRLWLRWREETCDLAAWETPNPYAHSIYSLVTAPCMEAETRARTAVLRRTYPAPARK